MAFKKIIVCKSGFTLFEMIMVLAVIGTLSAIVISNLDSWLPDYRLRSAARSIVSLMQETKLRAVKEDATAAMQLDFTNDTYFAWVNNGDTVPGTLSYDPGLGDVIFTQNNLPTGIDIYLNGSSDIANPFGFTNRGFPVTSIGSVFIKNSKSNYRRIIVNLPGNIRTQKSTDGTTWN